MQQIWPVQQKVFPERIQKKQGKNRCGVAAR